MPATEEAAAAPAEQEEAASGAAQPPGSQAQGPSAPAAPQAQPEEEPSAPADSQAQASGALAAAGTRAQAPRTPPKAPGAPSALPGTRAQGPRTPPQAPGAQAQAAAPPTPSSDSVDFGNVDNCTDEDADDGAAAARAAEAQLETPAPPQGDAGEEDDADVSGPPGALLIRQEGEVFSIIRVDMKAADRELLDLARLREAMVKRHSAVVKDGILPYSIAAEAVQLLKKQWRERPERKIQEDELWGQHGNHDVVSRTVQSNFRTWLHVTFGGRAWVHWFLMLGDLPSELIELANEHIRERVQTTEDREPRMGKHPHPKLSARNHAASRGEPLPAQRGVHHIRGEA